MHAHTKPRRMTHATLPTNNHICTSKHHRHHAQLKCNAFMLCSFARCGPSALAPSSPMLFAAIMHTHVAIILATLPTNNHVLSTSKHHHHHVQLKYNVVMLFSFARCGPSALAPSSPMLLSDIAHARNNHATIILATPPTNNHVLSTSKHHRHHAQLKSNVVMLCSFARCGPSALAPSSPMSPLTDVTHSHTKPRRHQSRNTVTKQPRSMHGKKTPPPPPRTAQIKRCHVAQFRQVWTQCLGAFLANVVRWHHTRTNKTRSAGHATAPTSNPVLCSPQTQS